MASKFLPTSLVLSLFIAGFAVPMHADDMLPPPPPGDDMMAPPPPGGDPMAPPAPGGDMMAPPPPGGDMAPPPGDAMAPPPPGGDMMAPPPPGGDAMAPPPPGGDMMAPPPPGGDAMAPPPPGGDMMAPPPGGDVMAPPPAGDTMAPPPADNLFPEEPKKESKKSSGGKVSSYEVAKHDSLWKIAGKTKVYGDAYQWPILFIANRELIKDPDMIKPGWDLKVKRNTSSDEVNNAVQKAKDTPRYEPHTAPRKKLPIDY